jgi:UDP-N-acetylmuramate--alanine ligase
MVAADPLWVAPPGSIPTLPVPVLAGIRRAHLIGIGGAGMRNLARLLLARGIAVQGSDLMRSLAVDELIVLGATVGVGHDAARVTGRDGARPDVVITSSAIAASNVELVAAAATGIPIWRRQQALAALGVGRRNVAVSGTHGKTTTTSLLAVVLEHAGLDPTYLIGGDLNETGGGARAGDGDLFLFEADESDGSFLLGRPSIGVITTIDLDHVDFFPGGLPEIEAAFARFATGCDQVVAFGDDPAVRRSLEMAQVAATTYGTGTDADLRVTIEHLGPEGSRGRVRIGDAEVPLALQIDGTHNLFNATAALGVAGLVGVDPAEAAAAMAAFRGVHRRFERRGTARGAEFFDDYGHIPTEMAVTIDTARRRAPRRLIALVQPHRYTRVEALWRELGASVAGADLVIVTDIYGAAQPPIPGVTGRLVADGVRLAAPDTETIYLPHRADVVTYLADEIAPGDLVVTMGCGDVWMLGDAVRERIAELDG